ncbi:amidase [Sphingomonas crocodyli]|nr:amidase family protein [Sphingomonas crocodyli]
MGLLVAASLLSVGASPPAFDVTEASIADLDTALADGRVTSRHLVEAYLARIAAYDRAGPRLNAIVRTNPKALAEADAFDRERRTKGPRGPLHGVPILVKDNYDTAGMPTSGGTLALATLQPTADAEQVAMLRKAGAIIIGKTTMHELAAGTTTVSSLTGYSRNPYDPARSPGGSSGGTGAAVAASFAAAGMGSDTCGSIRIPSAYQNLVGLRATSGLSSTKGVMPLSHTQDVAGPLARSVDDLAIMLDATVPDRVDGKSRGSYRAALRGDGLKGARIGVLRGYFGPVPDYKEGQDLVDRALGQMRDAGADLTDVTIPGLDDMLADSALILHEFKYDLAAYLAAQPYPPVASLSQILALGLQHDELDARFRQRDAPAQRDEAAYARAMEKRAAVRAAVLKLMAEQHLDAILYPTTLRRPPLIGGDESGILPSCQLSASAGLPVIAIPAGLTDRALPIGLELMGAPFAEPTLLRLAYGWERVAHPRKAPFSTPPLIDGKGPAVRTFATAAGSASARFRYDPTTGALDVTAEAGVAAPDVIALTIHRGAADGAPGPVLANLILPGSANGTAHMVLPARDRAELLGGRLYLALYTRTAPLGSGQAVIVPYP